MRINILLLQLGSPQSPTTKSIKIYLKEFLNDPRVIDIPFLLRFLLLRFIILPLRSPKSAKAYQKIWLAEGSPLIVYTQKLSQKLQKLFPSHIKVDYAMRYGSPSIKSIINNSAQNNVDKIIILPLYPQYASCTTGSSLEEFYSCLKKKWNQPSIEIIPSFYQNPSFINALAYSMKPYIDNKNWEKCIFSFHGIPERHIKKSEITPNFCLQKEYSCCEKISSENNYCYRAHCTQTAKKIAEQLGLKKNQYLITFQSRLGRSEWIKPYTQTVINHLPQRGYKNILVVAPSFTSDCLETIEELGIKYKKLFLNSGGESFTLIPCLNDQPQWVQNLYLIIKKHISKNDFLQ